MEGLYQISSNGRLEKVPYQPGSTKGISSEQIRNFVEDDKGNIWFGTFDGLHKYDAVTKEYKLIQIPQYMGGLTHPSIFSLYKDRQGTIWVGSYFGGVNYFNPQHTGFTHYNYKENTPTKLNYSYNGEITSDNYGHLWIGTDGGGVYCVDKEWSILKQFTAKSPNSLPHNNIKSICYDPSHNSLYIGTYLGGLSRYDLSSGHFHNYLQDKNTKQLLTTLFITQKSTTTVFISLPETACFILTSLHNNSISFLYLLLTMSTLTSIRKGICI